MIIVWAVVVLKDQLDVNIYFEKLKLFKNKSISLNYPNLNCEQKFPCRTKRYSSASNITKSLLLQRQIK